MEKYFQMMYLDRERAHIHDGGIYVATVRKCCCVNTVIYCSVHINADNYSNVVTMWKHPVKRAQITKFPYGLLNMRMDNNSNPVQRWLIHNMFSLA